ncbi:hypothetical protein Hanom_Chr06g00489731 [Helianthus anomalus]
MGGCRHRHHHEQVNAPSKRESNNSSPNLTTGSSSEINSDLLAPVRSSPGGVLEDLVNTVDQPLREALQNHRERLSGVPYGFDYV